MELLILNRMIETILNGLNLKLADEKTQASCCTVLFRLLAQLRELQKQSPIKIACMHIHAASTSTPRARNKAFPGIVGFGRTQKKAYGICTCPSKWELGQLFCHFGRKK
jgi:hypothetical protein